MAYRGLDVVRAAHAQVVAAIAGNKARARQARVKKQFLAQFDHRRIGYLGGGDRLDRFLFGGVQDAAEGQAGDEEEGGEGAAHSLTPGNIAESAARAGAGMQRTGPVATRTSLVGC